MLLMGGANVRNVIHGPLLRHDSRNNCDDRGDDLSTEQEARWDFHVMSEFLITTVQDRLQACIPGHDFEDHQGKRTPRKDITEKHLCQNNGGKRLGGYGL